MKLPPSVSHFLGAPRVQVRADDALSFVSAPTGSGAASDDAVAPVRPPSPTPATPPSPRAEARRRLAAFGLPLSSPAPASPSSSHGRRSGSWSPAALELPNGRADGVAPGARLCGDSSDAGIRGGSTSGHR
jgi:hypothetical protein